MVMNNFQRRLENSICGTPLHIPPEQLKLKIKNKQERVKK